MTNPTIRRRLLTLCGVLLLAQVASAEVVRIEIRRKDDFGTYERMIGPYPRYAQLSANRGIADIDQAPKTPPGWSSFHPMCCSSGRRTPAGRAARCFSKWSTEAAISRWPS
jgi:hypothetical protein